VLFSQYQGALTRMVDFRLDRRLYGRIDSNDVLQEAYLTIAKRYPEFIEAQSVSFFVWIRQMTFQTLLLIHRRHFGVQKRAVTQEVSLNWADHSNATSVSIAYHLAGNLTSPSKAAIRDETVEQLKRALADMDGLDREILALRHFEHLSNKEVSEVLEIGKTAASNRYVRALERLKNIMESTEHGTK
ncbi:MAG: sigma-70 family RNA polymerase sigma factor, partial [Planctomycetota bacterium]